MRHLLIGLFGLLVLATHAPAQQEPGSAGNDPVYTQDSINPMLGALEPAPTLQTPQAALEFYLDAGGDDEFDRAAHVLNLRLMPDVSAERAATLARRLYFVIDQELWIDWETLPDRPDGMDDSAPLNGSSPLIGQPRKSLRVGAIRIGDRDATIRLQRVTTGKPGDTPRWLISPFTVASIDAMYQAHGPGWLDERMPEWARVRAFGGVMIWQIIAMGLTFLIAPLLAWAATYALKWTLARVPAPTLGLYDALRWPVTFFLASIMISLVFSAGLSLPGNIAAIIDPLVLLMIAATGAWI
ncbi:MAG: hypothetical protein ACIAS6_12305, partial [Phycisphaerales bacterium JB060]